MSTSPLRAAMVPVTRRFRAYFAPVNRGTGAPTLFDPGKYGVFSLDQPPSPWIDLGWIDNFQRFCGVPTQPVRAGARGGPVSQYRGVLDVRLEFDFREWGKLQMALAAGSEHMNVLASDPNANPQPSGGTPILAVTVLTGSTANEIVVGVGSGGRICDRRHDRRGQRLRAANWVCGHRNLGSVRGGSRSM